MLSKKEDLQYELFDATKLMEGRMYQDVVCYVTGNRAGTTVYNKGYFTFFVKDVNGNVYPAHVWEPKDFRQDGAVVSQLKNVCVLMSFTAQIYNGSWSLHLEGSTIRICTPEVIQEYGLKIDLAKFRGTVPCPEKKELEEVYRRYTESDLPDIFFHSSFQTICQGRVGGYARLAVAVFHSMKAPYEGLQGFDFDGLSETFVIVLQAYAAYLRAAESAATAGRLADVLIGVRQTYRESKVAEQAIETLLALVGADKPRHLFAHIIVTELQGKAELLDLVYRNNTIPCSMSAQIGGLTLANY